MIQGTKKIQNFEKFKEFNGSCATWVLWYIDLRLMNPDSSREDIIKKSLKEINENSDSFTSFIKQVFNYYNRVSSNTIETKNNTKNKTKKKTPKTNNTIKTYVSSVLNYNN